MGKDKPDIDPGVLQTPLEGESPEDLQKRTGGGTGDGQKKDDGLAEIEINGQKYTVNKDMADALKAQESAMLNQINKSTERFDEILNEVNQLKQSKQQPEKDPEPNKIGDRLFEDPDGVLNEFGQRIVSDIEKKLTEKYQQDLQLQQEKQQLAAFWNEFNNRNSDISEAQPLANYVLQKNWNRWKDKTQNEVIDLLGDETRKEILGYVDKFKKDDNNQQQSRAVVEGSPTPSGKKEEGKGEKKKADETPTSITDLLKKRKEARRKQAGLKVG